MTNRSKRRWPWLWICVGTFIAMASLSPLIIYFVMRLHGRSLLRQEVELIGEEPLTTSEMNAYLARTNDPRATAAWTNALMAFETDHYKDICQNVPIVGKGTLPPLDEPLSEEQSAAVATYLERTVDIRDALHDAAALPGEVRFPRDYRLGVGTLLPELQASRAAVRSLSLEFQLLAREADLEPALRNLKTRFILSEVMRHEANIVGLLVHVALTDVNLNDIRALVNARQVDEAQLARLQAMIAPIDIHAQLHDAMLGERVMYFHAYQNQNAYASDFDDYTSSPRETTRDLSTIQRPHDCAKMLEIMRKLQAASRLPLPDSIDASTAAVEDLQEMSQLSKIRYMICQVLLPAIEAVVQADARAVANVRLTQAMLATHQYQRRHGRAPQSLADLVPEFLPAVPQDPFEREELYFAPQADSTIVLYSVGEDGYDDAGETNERSEPDIAVTVKFPKPTSE